MKEKYGNIYKGGILLIDEVDATLYGFAQSEIVKYLWSVAKEYKIQIVFTTHSPIILEQVNKCQRNERRQRGMEGINLPPSAYDSSIVYLEPDYVEGRRVIVPRNISFNSELREALSDINLDPFSKTNTVSIYCEDQRAVAFVQYVLHETLKINLDQFMSFVDIDLGWPNYIQLAEKGVPEFRENMIILDHDVLFEKGYKDKEKHVEECGNFLFLPLTVETGIFELLKQHTMFSKFRETLPVPMRQRFSYDVCFNHWTEDASKYKTEDFKAWYRQAETALGDQKFLFSIWCQENSDAVKDFVGHFVELFNRLADKMGVDSLPNFEP